MSAHLGNYIRAHRKQAGLNQRELARVLGYDHEGPVSRHERLRSLPPLLIAIGYSVVFGRPVSELFAGLSEVVEQAVEERLSELELELKESAAKSSRKVTATKKLVWLSDRRKPG
jgi:transcriptional regulator with XRE-family HTH domain